MTALPRFFPLRPERYAHGALEELLLERLAEGPCTTADLALWVDRPEAGVRVTLAHMADRRRVDVVRRQRGAHVWGVCGQAGDKRR